MCQEAVGHPPAPPQPRRPGPPPLCSLQSMSKPEEAALLLGKEAFYPPQKYLLEKPGLMASAGRVTAATRCLGRRKSWNRGDLVRLGNTLKLAEPKHQPNTTTSTTKPCPRVPQPLIILVFCVGVQR